jgi:tRNA G18 (ribose-2'-O)-methylase SpoU
MGSIFARPPARAELDELPGRRLALSAHAERTLDEASFEAPLVLCLGAEREGLPADLEAAAVRIPVKGAESLNVAMAAGIGLYEAARRMRGHG